MTLETKNPAFGFYGTIESAGESAETAWEAAFESITDATDAHDPNCFGPEGVRDFLDSRDGRHLADMVIDNINRSGATEGVSLTECIDRAVAAFQSWTIGPKTERDHGIPRGLPYLTGWVQHYAIENEMA